MTKPTHRVRAKCELRVRELADYMAASEQVRRSVLRRCKYAKIAQRVQHKEARATIANWLRGGDHDTAALLRSAELLRTRMSTTPFEADQNDHNADYLESFVAAFPAMSIPVCEMMAAPTQGRINLNGTEIVFNPDVAVARTTQKNTRKIGGIFLRYAKNDELPEVAAGFQSAFAMGFLGDNPFEPEAEPERKLCITIDGNSGRVTAAPSNSGYLWKEMSAACATIAERWPLIQPPENAIL